MDSPLAKLYARPQLLVIPKARNPEVGESSSLMSMSILRTVNQQGPEGFYLLHWRQEKTVYPPPPDQASPLEERTMHMVV